MNVFEAVKQSVTTRQAAEHYGIHVGRNGMACCPFHNDKTPKNKIERINQEIEKTREKIAEYQEKLKTLEAQKTEAENLEIVQMVRALRMTPAQLNAMLSGGMNHGRDTALPESNNQEATAYEE